jgi:hypothetical protein
MAFTVTMVVLVTGIVFAIVILASWLGDHLRTMRERQTAEVRASPLSSRARQPRRRPF